MSSLSNLRVALQKATSGSLNGLTFDSKPLDRETAKLRDWLGDRGSAKPPQNAIVAALQAFFQAQELQSFRQVRLVCFGCVERVPPAEARLIEDGDRFPKLLGAIDAYLPNPRAFRLCYKPLLNAYFSYDAETARFAGKDNWEQLREYLRVRAANTVASGLQPAWVDGLQTNLQLLGSDPGGFYGNALLTGQSEEFERAREALDIHENSWLIWRLVLGQIEAAAHGDDGTFQRYLPSLLALLNKHPLAINKGLAKLLARYCSCRLVTVQPDLRDFAVAQWGNPWLSLNQAKWSLVSHEARKMIADWLKRILIKDFFNLLTADGSNDTRRLEFWERYVDSIDDMYFALGSTALGHRGPDYQNARKRMAGRLLNLHSAGPPDNNAFIMCIGNHVVVEFGMKGNACFIFARDRLPFALKGEIAGNGTALRHPSFIERLLHIDRTSERWERKFERTLSSLIHVNTVQPAIVSRPQTDASQGYGPGLAEPRAAPYQAGPQSVATQETHSRISWPAQNAAPVHGTPFSLRELAEFCSTRKLPVQDLRDRNGNLWVVTGDTDGYVGNQLRSWGFAFKAGKGWWRK